MGNKVNIARQDTLEEVLGIIKSESVYGFIEHNAILAPGQRIEYIGANKNYTPITVTKGGGYSLGSWVDFPWLKANKPYMVRSDGTADYRLNENDYTKREDGTASDVANADYDGGAFAWAQKIYKKEYTSGDDRYVLFRFEKADGFEPVGFIDSDNNELEGVWIPMFYGSIIKDKMKCISGNQPVYNKNTTEEKSAIDAVGTRARFFGGPIVSTLIDLMLMFGKNCNLQEVYGTGNCNGYDQSQEPTYGVKRNAVVNGGQFYGTNDGRSLNKIFHSIVLGSYNQWMRDPYVICVNGELKVSKNYTYDISGASYESTGIKYTIGDTNWHYPHRYVSVPGYGAVAEMPFNGSTATGGCDGIIINKNITAVSLAFGNCRNGLDAGPRTRYLSVVAGDANWNLGAAFLLLPPAGAAA